MTAPALFLALSMMASDGAAAGGGGEPLPAGAPTAPYELTAWCYGALGEYLEVYDRVKPDLRDIDRMFGSSVKNEAEPYSADMAAARKELKILAGAVEAAEKASPSPIAPKGEQAIKLGQSIWRPAEGKTRRELARAWLSWGLPDRCDATARGLAANSALLGKALNYNNAPAGEAPPVAEALPAAAEPPPASSEPAVQSAPPPEAPPPVPAPERAVPTPAPAAAPPVPAPYAPPDPNGPIPDSPTPRA